MKTKCCALLALLAAVPALAAVVHFLSPPAPPPFDISEARVQLLEPGMSEAEVEAALGAPAGDYRSRSSITHVGNGGGQPRPRPGEFVREWYTDSRCVVVRFDGDGKAFHWSHGVAYRPPTRLQLLWVELKRYFTFS